MRLGFTTDPIDKIGKDKFNMAMTTFCTTTRKCLRESLEKSSSKHHYAGSGNSYDLLSGSQLKYKGTLIAGKQLLNMRERELYFNPIIYT